MLGRLGERDTTPTKGRLPNATAFELVSWLIVFDGRETEQFAGRTLCFLFGRRLRAGPESDFATPVFGSS